MFKELAVRSHRATSLFALCGAVLVFVLCRSAPAQPTITNTTQGTTHPSLADAVATSSPNDVIEIGQGVLFEQGLILQNRILTFRGQGPDQTIIDGNNVVGRIFSVRTGSDCVFESMTLRNGAAQNNGGGGGGAIRVGGDASAVVRNCFLVDNSGRDQAFGALVHASSGDLLVDHCLFRNNDDALNSSAIGTFGTTGNLTIVGCLFEHLTGIGGTVYFLNLGIRSIVNSTFAGSPASWHIGIQPSTGDTNIDNCAFNSNAAPFFDPNGTIVANRCVYSGASGNNIDAEPLFNDAANGDYSLAWGSPGIDAASYTSYANAAFRPIDLGGMSRIHDDAVTPDTGDGLVTWLDVGAFEYQGDGCAADFNQDGFVNTLDVITFLNAFNLGCP